MSVWNFEINANIFPMNKNITELGFVSKIQQNKRDVKMKWFFETSGDRIKRTCIA